MLCKRGLCCHAVSVCLSVCPSRSYILSEHIFEMFSPSGSHTILVFPHQTAWRYSDGNLRNGCVECRCGRQKSRFWAYIWLHCLQLTLQQARCCQYDVAGPLPRKLWHLSLVVSGGVESGNDEMPYDKKPQRYAKDNRTAHLTACSDKSVACVTNNKRLYSTFCTVDWQTRSIAQPLCDSRATCSPMAIHQLLMFSSLQNQNTMLRFRVCTQLEAAQLDGFHLVAVRPLGRH